MRLLASSIGILALSLTASAAYSQSATNNPTTNNENYSRQGSNAPGYAGYGHPAKPMQHRHHHQTAYQRDRAPMGGSPTTNNENWAQQGSNAPGYSGYGHGGDSSNNSSGWTWRQPYGSNNAGYGYGTPSTKNENWTQQGSNAPGYAGYGDPSGMVERCAADMDQ